MAVIQHVSGDGPRGSKETKLDFTEEISRLQEGFSSNPLDLREFEDGVNYKPTRLILERRTIDTRLYKFEGLL